MNPNGSTMFAKLIEPRYLIRLPVDLRVASEDDRRQRLALRKPQAKQLKEVRIEQTIIKLGGLSGKHRRQL
jgi:hypothetical protein